MNPVESPAAFTSFAAARGVSIPLCTPRQGMGLMFDFFQSAKPIGCGGADGDMLLFQWGTYDWGTGRHFSLNITRQFIEDGIQDDDATSQLSLNFRFEPTAELEALGEGNRWCDGPTELSILKEFALSSASFLTVADRIGATVELAHSYV
ncbi:hypothetical protein [Roseateles cavernae]|uniref:hypothetical protein n=1 Tax=Roseateles cavernae TaxID=3153578 RepID=UPI0032E50043